MDQLHVSEEFLTADVLRDPMPFLAKAREEFPIFKAIDKNGREIFVVTAYALVKEAFSKSEVFSNEYGHLVRAGSSNAEADAILAKADFDYARYGSLVLTVDDPEHKRLRNLISPAFTMGSVNRLTDELVNLADRLIDGFIDRGECDLIQDFAVPYSLGAILGILGLDTALIPRAYGWSEAAKMRVAHLGTHDEEIKAAHTLVDMLSFLRGKVAELRAHPGDDLVSHVMQSKVAGERPLTDDEVMAFMHEVIFAGNETSRNSLVAALALLLRNPDQLALLKQDLSLLPNAINEVLRHHSTGSAIWRIVKTDTELGGVPLPAGSILLLRQDSANHDETQFPDAEAFDITRKNARTHMTFGYGVHQCIGQALARRELEVGLERLLSRLDEIRLLPERSNLDRELNVILHILKKVHISFKPSRPS